MSTGAHGRVRVMSESHARIPSQRLRVGRVRVSSGANQCGWLGPASCEPWSALRRGAELRR